MKLNNPLISLGINIASFPMIFCYYFKSSSKITEVEKIDSVFFSDGKPDNIIPRSLRDEIGSLKKIDEKEEYFSKPDKKFFWKIVRRYPFSWHFLLKLLIKIRYYSYQIETIHPENIIVCCEYSYTSSILTAYCNDRDIKHINVMHGEKVFFMGDSFFRFNKCYVWDEYYKKLFTELRADNSQFVIEVPPSLSFASNIDAEKSIDFTYYLGIENQKEIKKIISSLSKLVEEGYRIAIRPHPRYSDMELFRNISNGIELEDCKSLSIEESLERTKNAISFFSTVLNQAYYNQVGVVIDDVTKPEQYNKLHEVGYIMLNKKHKLLSSLIGDNDKV